MPTKPLKYRILMFEPGLDDALEVKSFAHLADARAHADTLRAFAAARGYQARVAIARVGFAGMLKIVDDGRSA